MTDLFNDLTPDECVEYIQNMAQNLVAMSERIGVNLRIDRVALLPLAAGNMRHVVEVWPAKKHPLHLNRPETEATRPVIFVSDDGLASSTPVNITGGPPRTWTMYEMSDRERVAKLANMRKGYMLCVTGVGDL